MAALVAVSLIGTLAPVSPAAAVDGPDWAAATTCTSPVRPVVTLRPAGFTVYDPAYRYSYDQSVLTRALWTTPPTTDTVRNLEVYGFLWIPSLLEAMRSAPDADDRLAGLVSSVASTLVWRPDNRAVTDPVWNEGTNLRRQENLNCLYAVARDDRLLPLIQAVAHANLDPNRYYGPPQRPPHNHGLMANLALLNAGALLGRSDWRTAALGRMRTAIAASFTAVGLSIEQSSSYHQSVLSKWVGVSRRLRQLGGDDEIALATAVDSVLVRARRALGYLLMPNAVPVEFGDQSGLRTDLVAQSRLWFQDDAAGVLTARWSWSSPTTLSPPGTAASVRCTGTRTACRSCGGRPGARCSWIPGRRPTSPALLATGRPGRSPTTCRSSRGAASCGPRRSRCRRSGPAPWTPSCCPGGPGE